MIDIGSPQFMFMAEAEGMDNLISTRSAKINAVIKDVRNYPEDVISGSDFQTILNRHNLTDLTQDELEHIESRIR